MQFFKDNIIFCCFVNFSSFYSSCSIYSEIKSLFFTSTYDFGLLKAAENTEQQLYSLHNAKKYVRKLYVSPIFLILLEIICSPLKQDMFLMDWGSRTLNILKSVFYNALLDFIFRFHLNQFVILLSIQLLSLWYFLIVSMLALVNQYFQR